MDFNDFRPSLWSLPSSASNRKRHRTPSPSCSDSGLMSSAMPTVSGAKSSNDSKARRHRSTHLEMLLSDESTQTSQRHGPEHTSGESCFAAGLGASVNPSSVPPNCHQTRSGRIIGPSYVIKQTAAAESNSIKTEQIRCCSFFVDDWVQKPRRMSRIPTRIIINDETCIETMADLVNFLYSQHIHMNGIVCVDMANFKPKRRADWERLLNEAILKRAQEKKVKKEDALNDVVGKSECGVSDLRDDCSAKTKIMEQIMSIETDTIPSSVPVFHFQAEDRVRETILGGKGDISDFVKYAKDIDAKQENGFCSEMSFEENSHVLESKLGSGRHRALYDSDLNASIMAIETDKCKIDFGKTDPGIADIVKKPLPGISNACVHLGCAGSLFTLHSKDGDTLSANFSYVGKTFWYGVPITEGSKLEAVLRAHFPEEVRQCQNFMRHKTLFLPQAFLRAHDICYVKLVQSPGDLVLTFPRGYHQGFNATFSINETTAVSHSLALPMMGLSDSCTCGDPASRLVFDIRDYLKKHAPHCTYPNRLLNEGKISRASIIDPSERAIIQTADEIVFGSNRPNSVVTYVLLRSVISKSDADYFKAKVCYIDDEVEFAALCHIAHTYGMIQKMHKQKNTSRYRYKINVVKTTIADAALAASAPVVAAVRSIPVAVSNNSLCGFSQVQIKTLVKFLITCDRTIRLGWGSIKLYDKRKLFGLPKKSATVIRKFVCETLKAMILNRTYDNYGITQHEADALKAIFEISLRSGQLSRPDINALPEAILVARNDYQFL